MPVGSCWVKFNRVDSIYRPGATVPVCATGEKGSTLAGSVAVLLAARVDGSGQPVEVDRDDFREIEKPILNDGLGAQPIVRREPLVQLGWPHVETKLMLQIHIPGEPYDPDETIDLQLGRGIESHDFFNKDFRKRVFSRRQLKGIDIHVDPGPHHFGETVEVTVSSDKTLPLEVGVRLSEFGSGSKVMVSPMGTSRNTYSEGTAWEDLRRADTSPTTVRIQLPHDQHPTHDGVKGYRWAATAKQPGKKWTTDVAITVEA